MGVTGRGFRYPGYGDGAGIPDYFYNLATDVQSEFDDYDGFVNGQIAGAKQYSDQQLSAAYNGLNGKIDGNYATLNGGIGTVNQRITDLVQEGSWTPTFGGQNASAGNNPNSQGSFSRVGAQCTFIGRLVFGSAASFGNGGAVIGGVPIGLRTATASGTGYYTDGTYQIGLFFIPTDGTTFQIRRIKNDGNLGLGYDLGTPPQSAQMVFSLTGARQ